MVWQPISMICKWYIFKWSLVKGYGDQCLQMTNFIPLAATKFLYIWSATQRPSQMQQLARFGPTA